MAQEHTKDLEKAADNYSRNLDYYHYTSDDPAVAFKAGAEWQKNKMLEKAICTEVGTTCGIPSIWLALKDCKQGDKVKVIIIKED